MPLGGNGGREIAEKAKKAGKGVIEVLAEEKLPRAIRNIVFASMFVVMGYFMIRSLITVAAGAEEVAGYFASIGGLLLTMMALTLMIIVFVTIVKAIWRWV